MFMFFSFIGLHNIRQLVDSVCLRVSRVLCLKYFSNTSVVTKSQTVSCFNNLSQTYILQRPTYHTIPILVPKKLIVLTITPCTCGNACSNFTVTTLSSEYVTLQQIAYLQANIHKYHR